MKYNIFVTFFLATVAYSHAGEIEGGLLEMLQSQGKADAILQLPSIMGSVLSNPILSLLSGAAKNNFITTLMKQLTSTAQIPFLNVLQSFGVDSAQPFWIANKISMKGVDLPVINALGAIPGVFQVRTPVKVKLVSPKGFQSRPPPVGVKNGSIQWGVQKIGAPAIWPRTNGKGVLVANIDTGVYAGHEALKGNYAGKFHDAIANQSEPYDDGGHGTHVMGTICGQTNGIGVAPGARWIACKGLGPDGGDERTLIDCAQWFLTLDEKPAVICNSWGGGSANKFFNDEILAWQAANIIPVFAIGNAGPSCSSANSPGDQPNVISVGATTDKDTMARFSSRGPLKKTSIKKPEVSAPGDKILSAWPDGSYQSLSGTSMAAPHVTGAVALMKAINPKLTFKQILDKLVQTASQPTEVASVDLSCTKPSDNKKYPNNAYGNGIINVSKAMA